MLALSNKNLCLGLLIFSSIATCAGFSFKKVYDAINSVVNAAQLIMGGKDLIESIIDGDKQEEILGRMNEIYNKIENVEAEIKKSADYTIESINRYVVDSVALDITLNELSSLINRISAETNRMRGYSKHYKTLDMSTLQKFAESTVSPSSNAIQGLLDRINILVVGSSDQDNLGKKSLLVETADYLKANPDHICKSQRSAQQILYQMYTAVSLAEIKGYAMMQFSWTLLRAFGKGNFTTEAQLMRSWFKVRTKKTQELLKTVIQRSSTAVWRCDPDNHIESETYERLQYFLQGYVENEVNLNSIGTCSDDCAFHKYAKFYGCFEEYAGICMGQKNCTGDVYDCTYQASEMVVCQTDFGKPIFPDREYDSITFSDGRSIGKGSTCSSRLGPAFSTLVITGVRFRKVNQIIHLQVQEGDLNPEARINASTITWIPVSTHELDIAAGRVLENPNYFILNYDNRALDLDDIVGSPEAVVTGVKFKVNVNHLYLQVRLTTFNFETGQLDDPETKSVWLNNENKKFYFENNRPELTLDKPDIPTMSGTKSKILSSSGNYIQFTHTDVEKDLAQTAIPFFDIQDVITYPPVPLSGIGPYLKGSQNSGGFVGPKIFTHDSSRAVNYQPIPTIPGPEPSAVPKPTEEATEKPTAEKTKFGVLILLSSGLCFGLGFYIMYSICSRVRISCATPLSENILFN